MTPERQKAIEFARIELGRYCPENPSPYRVKVMAISREFIKTVDAESEHTTANKRIAELETELTHLGWPKGEYLSAKKQAESLFNENCTLRTELPTCRDERNAARRAFDAVHDAAGLGFPSWQPGQSAMANAAEVVKYISSGRDEVKRLREALERMYDHFQGPHASGDFTCSCKLPHCGLCMFREEIESVLALAASDKPHRAPVPPPPGMQMAAGAETDYVFGDKPGNPPSENWIIKFEDPDKCDLTFTGYGAQRAARTAFQRAGDQWSCRLFAEIASTGCGDKPVCGACWGTGEVCDQCTETVNCGRTLGDATTKRCPACQPAKETK